MAKLGQSRTDRIWKNKICSKPWYNNNFGSLKKIE